MSIIPFPKPGDTRPSRIRLEGPPGTPSPDDVALMGRVASGDTAALASLIDSWWAPLTAYASRLLDDTDGAEDVVQATFIRLWGRRAEWRPGSLRAYLFRLARNLVVDEVRRRQARGRAISASSSDDRDGPHTPAQIFHDDEVSATVDSAIQSLAPRRREVFTLAYLRGFSYREIAEIMDISIKTVENQMSAALSELRQRLKPFLSQ